MKGLKNYLEGIYIPSRLKYHRLVPVLWPDGYWRFRITLNGKTLFYATLQDLRSCFGSTRLYYIYATRKYVHVFSFDLLTTKISFYETKKEKKISSRPSA